MYAGVSVRVAVGYESFVVTQGTALVYVASVGLLEAFTTLVLFVFFAEFICLQLFNNRGRQC